MPPPIIRSPCQKKKTARENPTRRAFWSPGPITAWWVRTEQGHLAEAMPRIRKILASTQNVIIESNSILRFLKPDLYLTVLDPQTADFKTSAQTFLDRADAVLLHSGENSSSPAWKQVSLKPVMNRPIFEISPPNYVTPEVVNFVRARLSQVSPTPHLNNFFCHPDRILLSS